MATSTRKNTRSALADSMRAESATFKARLERADAVLSPASAPAPVEDDEPSAEFEAAGVGRVGGTPTPKAKVQKGATVKAVAPEVRPVERVVRETFTIPEAEHTQVEAIRGRMLGKAVAVTKSEVVRAGLLAISELDDKSLVALFNRLERVKTGRPKSV